MTARLVERSVIPGFVSGDLSVPVCATYPLDDVAAAEEAFIASTVREAMPIAAVDDIELPSAPGLVTEAAREALARRIERELGAPA